MVAKKFKMRDLKDGVQRSRSTLVVELSEGGSMFRNDVFGLLLVRLLVIASLRVLPKGGELSIDEISRGLSKISVAHIEKER